MRQDARPGFEQNHARLARIDAPKVRVRVCVECGMPLAEHKDWCAIHQQQLEREKLLAKA